MTHFSAPWYVILPALLLLFGEVANAQGFNVSSIDASLRAAWCHSQIQTCPLVCNSAGSSVTNDENSCNPQTLETICTCVNGFSPDMNKYTNTIPFFECQQVASNCVAENPNDLSAQQLCEQEQAAFCGSSEADVTSVFHVTATASDGSKTTSSITLTLVQAAAATTSSSSSSSSTNSSTSSSSRAPSTAATSKSSSPSTSPTSSSGGSGISSGALAAAIAVPIIVVVLIALGLGLFMYRRRKQRSAKVADAPSGFEKPELHGEAVVPHEMPNQERFEMEGEGIPGEMQVNEAAAHEIGVNSPNERGPGL